MPTNSTTTIQSLATEILSKRRVVDSKRTPGLGHYIIFDDVEPDSWVTTMFHDAHGDMLPDDWRYEFIDDALQLIEEIDLDDDEDTIRERFDEWIDGAYIYTYQITGWLHSRTDRYDYVDQSISDFRTPDNTIQALEWGLMFEAREVFESVLRSLQARAEEVNKEARHEND